MNPHSSREQRTLGNRQDARRVISVTGIMQRAKKPSINSKKKKLISHFKINILFHLNRVFQIKTPIQIRTRVGEFRRKKTKFEIK